MVTDKYAYIRHIIMFLQGRTGIMFQLKLGEVLRKFFHSQGKTFEIPSPSGGDKKNDGWVVEDKVFYQIYAPVHIKSSFKKDLQQKFKEDFEGLAKMVYEDKRWGEEIKEFIFVVDTKDMPLPEDSERYYDTVALNINNKYGCSVRAKVVNLDYIGDLLEDISDITVLKSISERINIDINPDSVNVPILNELIKAIADKCAKKLIDGCDFSYNRISTLEKIRLNELEEARVEIEKIMENLDVVDKAISQINQDVSAGNQFECVRNHLIMKYKELSLLYRGKVLYENIVAKVVRLTDISLESSVRYLVVYVFDKCDIFERE